MTIAALAAGCNPGPQDERRYESGLVAARTEKDRFLSQDYRPEIYTKPGIDWVEENSMKSIISRHFPSVLVLTT